MKTYTHDELDAILKDHRKWVLGEGGGVRANLQGATLGGANLRGANLRGANLRGANLQGANLLWAYLQGATLGGAYLQGANLRGANLQGANLRWAYLQGATLGGANLRGANLQGASLPHFLIVPQQGAFIAWKKTRQGVIKIEIPADAHRCNSLVGRKCRAEFVRTLAIEGSTKPGTAYGLHNELTAYSVGEITHADKYDDDIRVECTHGIHFFMTREEAEEW